MFDPFSINFKVLLGHPIVDVFPVGSQVLPNVSSPVHTGEGRKANAVDAYSSFLKMTGGTWNPPKYTAVSKASVRSKRNRD